MISVGDAVYLWVHEAYRGSNGAGLTAKAQVAKVEERGADDLDITVEQVQLIEPPVTLEQIKNPEYGASSVSQRLDYVLRQSLHIAYEDVPEWEAHYQRFAEIRDRANARLAVEQLDAELTEESRDRFQKALARPAQGKFRTAIMERHNFRCAISGEGTAFVLEAAHVLPFASHPKHRISPLNGILLRSDLHRLFDAGLLSVHAGKVVLAEQLRGTTYDALHERQVTTTAHEDYLRKHHETASSMQTRGPHVRR